MLLYLKNANLEQCMIQYNVGHPVFSDKERQKNLISIIMLSITLFRSAHVSENLKQFLWPALMYSVFCIL